MVSVFKFQVTGHFLLNIEKSLRFGRKPTHSHNNQFDNFFQQLFQMVACMSSPLTPKRIVLQFKDKLKLKLYF